MNHETAMASEAVERYLLEELSPEERDEFEEHYFECEKCASSVRTGTVLKVNGKALAKEAQRPSRPGPVTELKPRPGPISRSFWMSGIPAAAAAMLAIVVGYQNLVTIPQLAASDFSPRAVGAVHLLHDQARGDRTVVKLEPGAPTVLALELTALPVQPAYRVSVISNGKPVYEIANAPLQDGALHIVLPSAFAPGNYEMLVRGLDESAAGHFPLQVEK